jgi:hypothetical protein
MIPSAPAGVDAGVEVDPENSPEFDMALASLRAAPSGTNDNHPTNSAKGPTATRPKTYDFSSKFANLRKTVTDR